ncbi:MAG: DUF5610 domain-containing protein [Thiomicrorhabdus sp.]|nr:DUF5610 domain-containing protein [Thiomicrorhabdus sp.]
MAIDINNTNPIQAYQNTAKQTAAAQTVDDSKGTLNKTDPTEPSSLSTMKTDQQASLIAHLFGDGKSANESSLKLTFQASIEKLNEILSAEFGLAEGATAPISEETLQQQGGMEYWTPENTAQRIVDGSTAFFAAFQSANPDLEGEALMDRFIEVVGGGVTQGFEEAKGLLGDMKVLEGSIADNIDKTYTLVQEGFQNFRNQYLGISNVTDADNTPPKTDDPQGS